MACSSMLRGSLSYLMRPTKSYLPLNGELGFIKGLRGCRSYSAQASPAPSNQLDLIKQLRERSSASIKDVKNSLAACNWDLDLAYSDLRKKGIAGVAKKASRVASEGVLAMAQAQDGKIATVIEFNCETDFVARNEIFQYLGQAMARSVLNLQELPKLVSQSASIDSKLLEDLSINLDHPKLPKETIVRDAILEVASMMGENLKLRRIFAISSESGVVSSYLHRSSQPGIGRVAGLVTLEPKEGQVPKEKLQQAGMDLAMHIVAAQPKYISMDRVNAEELEALRTEYKSEVSGKPEPVVEKIVEGRLRKVFEEQALLEQKYAMNDEMKVKTVLEQLSNEVGQQITVGSFLRVEIGEGVERRETNFAEEVAALVG